MCCEVALRLSGKNFAYYGRGGILKLTWVYVFETFVFAKRGIKIFAKKIVWVSKKSLEDPEEFEEKNNFEDFR